MAVVIICPMAIAKIKFKMFRLSFRLMCKKSTGIIPVRAELRVKCGIYAPMGLTIYPNISDTPPTIPPAKGPNIIPPKIIGNPPKPILTPSIPPIAIRILAILVKIILNAINKPILVIIRDDIFIFILLDIALISATSSRMLKNIIFDVAADAITYRRIKYPFV